MPADRPCPPHVHRKRAKGRTYYYFDTGARVDGKPVLKRLPDLRAPEFGAAYAAAMGARSRRATAASHLTVAELVQRYERSPEFARKADNTQRAYLLYLKPVVANLGMAPADDVTRADVLKLLDTFADRPGAANIVLAVVAALYTWGRRRGLVSISPANDIEPNDSADYQPWEQDLVDAALACEDVVVRTAVALLYFTAQRIGDVCRMRWSDIRSGVIHVRQQKTGIQLEIPVHDTLRDLLGAPQGVTILVSAGKPFTPAAIRGRIQRWASERGHRIVPHGLRKNAVNALLEAGCTAAEASAISGQSLAMVEHYAKRRNQRRLGATAILKWQGNKP